MVSNTTDRGLNTEFFWAATCLDDKRAIAGAGNTSSLNLFVTDSNPVGSNGWAVRWETDNNGAADPSFITVYALCAPRL